MSALTEALSPLLTAQVEVPSGSVLFHQGETIEHYYVVRSGCVHLVRWGAEGACAVMQRATDDCVLAESSVFASAYHCEAMAVAQSVVARASIRRVRAELATRPELLRELAEHLGSEVHRLRAKVELLAHRTVADRLDAWLALNGRLPRRGAWRSIAEDIGVSPEAFYRELQRRRASSS